MPSDLHFLFALYDFHFAVRRKTLPLPKGGTAEGGGGIFPLIRLFDPKRSKIHLPPREGCLKLVLN